MQKLASPNVGRTVEGGQKKSGAECTVQVRNTHSHQRVHCVCREGLYGADALYADSVLHATCLTRTRTLTLPLELFNLNFVVSSQALAHERY